MEGNARKIYYLFLTAIAVAVAYMAATPGPMKPKASRSGKSAAVKAQAAPPKPAKQRDATPAAAPGAETKQNARKRLAEQKLERIQTPSYIAEVSNLNAGLAGFQLKGKRYRTQENVPIDLVTTDKEAFLPLAMELDNADTKTSAIDENALWQVERLSERALRYSWQGRGLYLARKLEAGNSSYQLWATTTIVNRGDKPVNLVHRIGIHHYVERKAEKAAIPILPVRAAAMSNGLCRHAKAAQGKEQPWDFELERLDGKKLLSPHVFHGQVVFAGVENVYFLKAMAPDSGPGRPLVKTCELQSSDRGKDESGDPLGTLFSTTIVYSTLALGAGQAQSYRVLAYLGPKTPEELSAAGHTLNRAIDLGFFAKLSEGLTWLLRIFHQAAFGNWGLAIILLTIFVKVALYPLTATSYKSMAKMRALKPEMDRVNEMYKDDRERRGAALMELYRKHKINPMGGCLPQLLQLPIWIALYTSLSTEIELFRAPFVLWWKDLSAPDPYYVLPLALGMLMFVQQKMTPATLDEMQTKMMLYIMPVMMTALMLFLPAGLCLYILTNSVLSIGQQKLVERQYGRVSPPQSASGAAGSKDDLAASDKDDKAAQEIDSVNIQSERRSRRGRKK